jgi:hypothetical protein
MTANLRIWRLLLLVCLGMSVGACQGGGRHEEMGGAGLTGIDHLADHLSVQNFSLNGKGGAQAGKGGRTVCCASLPLKWRPDLTAVVRWRVTNWRDCRGDSYERVVPVDPYKEIGHVWVHFLSDGSARVVSSDPGPGNPHYPGPNDEIPQKEPWDTYDWESRCPKKAEIKVKETLQ